ncbi:MAG: hypothetical protein MI723_10665 [Caulobacterales bacterium]|nr:hypothetical protein [Caulobacterales bacterium]
MTKTRIWIAAATGGAAALALITAASAADRRGGPGMHHGQHGHHGARGFSILNAADADNDRSVTRAEFEELQAEMFTWLDRTGDGQLDEADRSPIRQRLAAKRAARAEAAEEAGEPFPHGRRGPRVDHDFGRGADANKDGVVTSEEFSARHVAMFDRLDADDDDVVTPEELDAAAEKMRNRGRWWRQP